MTSAFGWTSLLMVLYLAPVSHGLICYKCKYDERLALDKEENGFYNALACNTGADWDKTKAKTDHCAEDNNNFCRVYTYTLNSKTIVERSCTDYCDKNSVVAEVHGATTSTKKTYCCHGDYCNDVLANMKTTTEASTTMDGNTIYANAFRVLFISAAAWFFSSNP